MLGWADIHPHVHMEMPEGKQFSSRSGWRGRAKSQWLKGESEPDCLGEDRDKGGMKADFPSGDRMIRKTAQRGGLRAQMGKLHGNL